jgi:hypothetical protein
MYLKLFTIILCFVTFKNIKAQSPSLVGTRWDISVPNISEKPYNVIFGVSKKGNILFPENELADFIWSEDGNGNWSITVERMIKGFKKIDIFYGKINRNSGTGFYSNTVDKKNLKPLTMLKKQ